MTLCKPEDPTSRLLPPPKGFSIDQLLEAGAKPSFRPPASRRLDRASEAAPPRDEMHFAWLQKLLESQSQMQVTKTKMGTDVISGVSVGYQRG
jgi:hypothetical protein